MASPRRHKPALLGPTERDEMPAAAALARSENPKWRWLYPLTVPTREFMREQIAVLQIAFAIGVCLIYLSARSTDTVSPRVLNAWLLESVLNLVARVFLYIPVFRASQLEIVESRLLRMIPLFGMLIVGAHWTWTTLLFLGPELSATTVIVLLVYVMLSVAAIAVAPGSPTTAILYLMFLWVPVSFRLLDATWLDQPTFVALVAALLAVLAGSFRVVVRGVRRYLLRSDEVDLLVGELRERNAEVERLHRSSAEEVLTRSAFFASASHDFRQRVHAMKLLAQIGVRDLDPGHPGHASLVRLTGAVDDLEFYITNVLEFAQLESTTLSAKRSREKLQDIFQQIAVEFEQIAAENHVDVSVRATAIVLSTDSKLLLRILENLVSNAIKFSRGRVLIAGRRRAEGVFIEVWDQGSGIPPDALEAVFEPFKQAHDISRDPTKGVGLGLAIVRRLTDALGYQIKMASRPGRGTLVRVIVPPQDVVSERP